MKSRIIIAAVMMIICRQFPAQAQTRFETMMNQVAGLETYLKTTEGVYSTTSKGLNDIHDAKNGSFTLNQDYFNSLKNVSPAVKNDPKIKAISDLQQQIQSVINNSIAWQQSQGQLTSSELGYMKSVYTNLLSECGKDLQELTTVVTNGQVQMTDKARITKIAGIYNDMQQKNTFCQSFAHNAYELANDRISGKNSKQSLQTLYNIK